MMILYNLFFAGLAAGLAAGCTANPFMSSTTQPSIYTTPATSTATTATTATATTATATTATATTATATTATERTTTERTNTAATTTIATATTATERISTVTKTSTRTTTVLITTVPSSTATYKSVHTTHTVSQTLTDAPQTTQYCLNGDGQADIPTWSDTNMTELIANFCQTRQGLTFNASSNYNQSLSLRSPIVLFTIDWNNWDLACQDQDVSQHVGENCTDIMHGIFNECSAGHMAGGYCYRGCLTYKFQKATGAE